MNIRPIKTEADYQAVLEEIERLFNASPDTPDGDRLQVLTTLVEVNEEQKYHIPLSDPIEAILYYLESRGLSRTDLTPYLGDDDVVDEILNRRRGLSIEMIRRLHSGLGIAAETLIQPYALLKFAA